MIWHSQMYLVIKKVEEGVDTTVKCADKIGKLEYLKEKVIYELTLNVANRRVMAGNAAY
jgi:hypothetical protein